MNFVTAVVVASPKHYPQLIAAHHQRAVHPRARHAYRLSQVITYGVVAPQTFVH